MNNKMDNKMDYNKMINELNEYCKEKKIPNYFENIDFLKIVLLNNYFNDFINFVDCCDYESLTQFIEGERMLEFYLFIHNLILEGDK